MPLNYKNSLTNYRKLNNSTFSSFSHFYQGRYVNALETKTTYNYTSFLMMLPKVAIVMCRVYTDFIPITFSTNFGRNIAEDARLVTNTIYRRR